MESVRIGARLVRCALVELWRNVDFGRVTTLALGFTVGELRFNIPVAYASGPLVSLTRTLRSDIFVSTLPFLGCHTLRFFYFLHCLTFYFSFTFRFRFLLLGSLSKGFVLFRSSLLHFCFVYLLWAWGAIMASGVGLFFIGRLSTALRLAPYLRWGSLCW